jgi:diguanylate cyclase (GGDEF)-like protein
MIAATGSRQERLLHAILDLSAFARGGLGDVSLAERILRASADVFTDSRPRVALVQGQRLVGFSPDPGPAVRTPMRLGCLDLSPLVVEWMRRSVQADRSVIWPEGIVQALDLDPSHAVLAPLRGTDAPLGLLAVHGPFDNASDRDLLGVLATHAGTVVENARLYQRLEEEADTDGLTGAYNYRHFMRTLAREMDRVNRAGTSLAVIMVDVDNLKEYNDRFGHLGGSSALRELAELLRANTRSVDLVAKYGGDEFSLLLPDSSWEGARTLAERLRQKISEHLFEGDVQRRLTVSMGLAVFPEEGTDPRDLLRCADARLYEAKRSGRNRIGTRSR